MSKKLLAALSGILITAVSFGQIKKCDSIIQVDFIAGIKNYNPMDLVPYNVPTDGHPESWGFMHRETKKVLTKPLMDYAGTFKPGLSFFYDECDVEIAQNYRVSTQELMIWEEEYVEKKSPIQLRDSINGYRGFEVNEKGDLIAYSEVYYKRKNHYWNISKPIFHKDEYYAIVKNKTGNHILIDTDGVVKSGFDFKKMMSLRNKTGNDDYLYVEDDKGNKGFITLDGQKKLFGELMKSPNYHNEIFGYSLQHDGMSTSGSFDRNAITKSGVLDLTTLKWLFKPSKKLKIVDMVYTSDRNIKTDAENRKDANIYFVVKKRKSYYLIDEEGNPYKPTK